MLVGQVGRLLLDVAGVAELEGGFGVRSLGVDVRVGGAHVVVSERRWVGGRRRVGEGVVGEVVGRVLPLLQVGFEIHSYWLIINY